MKTFLVTGHCSSEQRVNLTVNLIKKIKEKFVTSKILYVDHVSVSQHICDIVDYSIHVNENLIQNFDIITPITKKFSMPYWKVVHDKYSIFKTIPSHSYAHHNLIHNGLKFLRSNNLDKIIHFLNYDCDHDVLDVIEKNQFLINDQKYDAVFYPYRYDSENGLGTEFFSISKKVVDVFLKMDCYSKYEDTKIIRDSDYNIEYIYFSHLKHNNFNYFLHQMWPKRNGEIGCFNFSDISIKDDLNLIHNNPQNKYISIIPYIDIHDDLKLKIFLMRVGHQIAETFRIEFLNEDKIVSHTIPCTFSLNMFSHLIVANHSKYLRFVNDDVHFSYDLTDFRNYGEMK